jgi:cytochrome c biogenesis protein CcdA
VEKATVAGSKKRGRVAARCVAACIWLALALPAGAEGDGVVRLVYFTSGDCENCGTVRDEVLAPLLAQLGDGMEIKVVDIYDPDAAAGIDVEKYQMLREAERVFGVSAEDAGVPMIVVGADVLIGEQQIREELQCVIEGCYAEVGTSWPEITGLEAVPVVEDLDSGSDGASIISPGIDGIDPCAADSDVCTPVITYVAYFYEAGCQECSRVEYVMRNARSLHPELVVEKHNVHDQTALAEWLGEEYGVPERKRLSTPSLFVGDDYLIGSDITDDALLTLAEKYATTGAAQVWAGFDPEQARAGLVDRFESFGVLTIAAAGLVDGLNPCAFTTLIFFISYLTVLERKGRDLLTVGASFTLGVFAAYMLVGLGLWQLLSLLPFLGTLTTVVSALMAAVCVALAIMSFRDAWRARRGELQDMTLAMPRQLRRLVNAVIRRGAGARALVLVALPVGAIVSLLELACTGQVYLPTIMSMLRVPEMAARAVLLLVLYNLMFVLPLIVVFLLAYFGMTSLGLSAFLKRHAAAVKAATGVLFLALTLQLLLSLRA